MKVSRLGCAPSNSAWFHTCARDNRTISQAEGNEQTPTVWADATDAKYVTLSVAYVAGAKGRGERGKGRGIGRVFCLFLSPAPPLHFLSLPRRLRYRYQSWSLKLTDAFCCSQGLALYVLNDNAVTMGALSPLTENLKWCRVTCYWCLHRGWTHSHIDVAQTFLCLFRFA